MARKKSAAEPTKESMAQLLGAAGAAFGVLSIVAPRAVANGYGVPVTPGGLQLQRLLGSRALALSVLTMSANTDEQLDRGLTALAAANLIDTVTALGSAAKAGSRTTTRAVASSLAYGAAALWVRSMKR